MIALLPVVLSVVISCDRFSPISATSDSRPLTQADFARARTKGGRPPPPGTREGAPGKFEGDIDLDGHDIEYYKNSFPIGSDCPSDPTIACNGLKDRRFHWPKPQAIPYCVSSVFTGKERLAIAHAVLQYNERTCVRWVERTTETDYVNIVKENGCWSVVGRRGGQQKLSIGNGCASSGVVQHEMMHALGFFHEQSRADRDSYVRIQFQNIQTGMEHNFQKYTLDRIDHLNTAYDYNSLMHYGTNYFSKNGRPTIVVLRGGARIGQREKLSENDIRKINRMYCGGGGGPTRPAACSDKYPVCSQYKKLCFFMKDYCCATCGGGASSSSAGLLPIPPPPPPGRSPYSNLFGQVTGSGTPGGRSGTGRSGGGSTGGSGLSTLIRKGAELIGIQPGTNPFSQLFSGRTGSSFGG